MMSTEPIYFGKTTPPASSNESVNNKKYIIFVEGQDDAHFLDVLLHQLNANVNEVGIFIVDGKERFKAQLTNFKKTAHFREKGIKSIALLCDGDDNPIKSVTDVQALFFDNFRVALNNGEMLSDNDISYGFFVLPDGASNGDLELLCLNTVNNTFEKTSAEKLINLAKENNGLKGHEYKRQAQIYLATKPGKLCRGVGMGFKHGHFEKTHDTLNGLNLFLHSFINQ